MARFCSDGCDSTLTGLLAWKSRLDVPPEAVIFPRFDGTRVRADKKLGSLRSKWMRHLAAR
jgi:hypothetical protein